MLSCNAQRNRWYPSRGEVGTDTDMCNEPLVKPKSCPTWERSLLLQKKKLYLIHPCSIFSSRSIVTHIAMVPLNQITAGEHFFFWFSFPRFVLVLFFTINQVKKNTITSVNERMECVSLHSNWRSNYSS
jgi:hypothetical protein